MKYSFKVVTPDGDNACIGPYEKVFVKPIMVEHIPSIGDPEDPNDVPELILWLEVM